MKVKRNSDIYSKKSGSLWLFCKDKLVLNNNCSIIDFASNNTTVSLKFKEKITVQASDADIKRFKVTIPLKYLSNFWEILEITLIKCEINLILSWS